MNIEQSSIRKRNTWHLIRYAYHEAGHAAVGHVVGRCISDVSIISNQEKEYRGYCSFDAFLEDANNCPQWQKGSANPELITIMYAGTNAMSMICEQRRWKYERWRGCDKADFDFIYLWSLEMFPNDEQRSLMQRTCQKQARDILRHHWVAVDALAAVLSERGRVSGGEAHLIIRHALGETSNDWRMEAWNITP